MPEPGPIKFPAPPKPVPPPNLTLRRRPSQPRDPFVVSEASAVARESIRAIVSASRSPFTEASPAEMERVIELQRTLRQLELSLAERERLIAENETRLADRERDIAETAALLDARERMQAATRAQDSESAEVSPKEAEALKQLRAELDRQEASLKESREALREREQFVDASETKLFEKVQAQQEKEIELEQREEDLRARERRLREREALHDPKVAAALKAEAEAAKHRDEFNE